MLSHLNNMDPSRLLTYIIEYFMLALKYIHCLYIYILLISLLYIIYNFQHGVVNIMIIPEDLFTNFGNLPKTCTKNKTIGRDNYMKKLSGLIKIWSQFGEVHFSS